MPNLLVIDDEPSILHAFRRCFRDTDLVIATASTAAEGVRAVEQGKPDAVVVDVHLPDATGLETFERIRAIDARIPAIETELCRHSIVTRSQPALPDGNG